MRSILEEILGSGKLKIQAATVTQTAEPEKIKPVKAEEPVKKQKSVQVKEAEAVEELYQENKALESQITRLQNELFTNEINAMPTEEMKIVFIIIVVFTVQEILM